MPETTYLRLAVAQTVLRPDPRDAAALRDCWRELRGPGGRRSH
jgi:hypothetical protein